MNRRHFIRSGATAIAAVAAGVPVKINAAPKMSDLSIIRDALKLHPGLYRYQSPATFEKRFADFSESWNQSSELMHRFLALSRFTAQIRCGHSHCNPYNQSNKVVAALFDRKTRVPFSFRWLDRKMVVIGDAGAAAGIARGSVIERLNGKKPSEMLTSLMAYARADGSNDAKRIAQMDMRCTDELETFDIFQGLLFPPGPNGHQVTWCDPAGKRHSVILPTIDLATRKEQTPSRKDDGPIWDWQVRPDGVAVLTMPTWVTYRGNWDWKAWLAERFASLSSTKGMIIDLRDNEGGTDCGTYLLQRLIDKPFKPVRYLNRVAFREVPTELIPYLTTWDKSFRTLGKDAVVGSDGYMTIPGDEDEIEITPIAPRITVPVMVLVGPVNSSATFSFARRVREAHAATLVGETTGGNLRGINGGAYFFVRLPESDLEFDLPLKGYFPEGPIPADAGVVPDIRVTFNAADIAHGIDRQMETAIRKILGG